MDLISSRSNSKIKQVRLLRGRSARLAQKAPGLVVVEGLHPVGEAVAAAQAGKMALESIIYAPELLKSDFGLSLVHGQSAAGLPCYPVTRQVFESVADKDNPQGILAVARPKSYSLESLSAHNFPWAVGLVAPQDPGNVGTILRTIDAVGASGLLLLDNHLDPYHPSAVRASMGTLFWHPLVTAAFSDFAAWAGSHSYLVVGSSAHAAAETSPAPTYPRPLILLLGSERQGLSPEQAKICQMMLRLPMRGRVTSLNLAVAGGVLLYHLLLRIE
jgi:RNA methyltransferase, TrmH family